jgi:hypothetical protein
MATDVGLLCWGVAYWLSTLHLRINAGRIISLDLFGSVMPAASLLKRAADVAADHVTKELALRPAGTAPVSQDSP